MSEVLKGPVVSGSRRACRRCPAQATAIRIREITPMGFLMLVALIYLFIMVTFVLATLRSQASLSPGCLRPVVAGPSPFRLAPAEGFQRWHLFHLVEELRIHLFRWCGDRGPCCLAGGLRARNAALPWSQGSAVPHDPHDGDAEHGARDPVVPRGVGSAPGGRLVAGSRDHGLLPIRHLPLVRPLPDDPSIRDAGGRKDRRRHRDGAVLAKWRRRWPSRRSRSCSSSRSSPTGPITSFLS